MRRAQELDPLSPGIRTDLGLCYFYMRQYDQAATHFKRMTNSFRTFSRPIIISAGPIRRSVCTRRPSSNIRSLFLSLTQGRHTMVMALLGYTYAISGQTQEARNMLRKLDEMSARQYVLPCRFAIIYTGLGEKDLAFQALNRAYDELDILLIFVNQMPFYDPIRDDPRFRELLQRLGLASP